MNISEMYTISVFEVLGEDTKKYSTTLISGGETNAQGHSSGVRSDVVFHSDQDIWVKNIDTEKERKFSFRSYNIDVRPRHKILCAWNKESGKLERIININTGSINAASGYYNDWTDRGKTLTQSRKRPILTNFLRTLTSLFISSPFVGSFIGVISSAIWIIGYWGRNVDSKVKDNRFKKLAIMSLLAASANILAITMIDDTPVLSILTFIFLPVAHFMIFKRADDIEYELIKSHSDALDDFTENYIALKKKTWLAHKTEEVPA